MERLIRAQRGLTLVELVLFIVLVAIAFSSLLMAVSTFNRGSADPLIRKQALAIAESLLDEVALMPFTFCDPDDNNAALATGPTDCTGNAGPGGSTTGTEDTATLGPESGESRGGAVAPFDNVSDYNGFSMNPIVDIANNDMGLTGYSASVTVAQAGADLGIATAADALLITVTVTPPSGDAVVLHGYRARYAPRTSQ